MVALNVPSQVRKGSEVELACLYDLGNASLYSLKWFYRANDTDLDEQEFFRYTPTIHPVKQFFPLDGINVNVIHHFEYYYVNIKRVYIKILFRLTNQKVVVL